MDGEELSAVHSVGSQRTGQAHVAAGIEVVDIDCGNPANAATLKKYGVRSWPQFNICRRSTKKLITRFSGYTTAFIAGIDQGPRATTSGGASWQHCSGCGLTQIMGAEQLHLQPAAIVGRDATGAGLESSC
jgi:hypothetical protein